ncbi:hypothetical protein [Plantactinospora endophytica]|uniref:Uncharacterized protein n=1 Tax=Plantactinospora endophytica TaxID=673535 RepID=A0ABQ4DU74_9ACTN|nr:hypothetical protein [Plantactinospora endophytica]GIG85994.1 hypothetical protein Pen02_09300 [Plantactinospora endophytica]
MKKTARWAGVVLVGGLAAAITMVTVLRLASGNHFKWTIATSIAVAVFGLAGTIGASLVKQAAGSPATGPGSQPVRNQTVKNSTIIGTGSGITAAIIGEVNQNPGPPAGQRSSDSTPPGRS